MIYPQWRTPAMQKMVKENLDISCRMFVAGTGDYELLRTAAMAYEWSRGLEFNFRILEHKVFGLLETMYQETLLMSNPTAPSTPAPAAPPTPTPQPAPAGNPPGTTPPERPTY